MAVIAASVLPLLCRGTGVDAARGARHDRPVCTRSARAVRSALDDRLRTRSLGSHSRGEPLALGGSAVLLDLDGDDDAQLTHAHRLLTRTRTLRAAAARARRREHHAQLWQ